MDSGNFIPRTAIERLIRSWWLLLIFMVIGGIIGYSIFDTFPPRYEAAASIATGIDYTFSPELEDYEEDRAINEAGRLIMSDSVLNNVETTLKSKGYMVSHQEILDTFYTERIDDLWTLRVTGSDPIIAAEFANTWLDEAYTQLDDAFKNAQDAYALTEYINSLEDCLQADPVEAQQYALCNISSTDEINKEIERVTNQRNDELILARAQYPAMRYSIVSEAYPPSEPDFHSRGILVLSSSVFGLVFAILVVFLIPFGKKAEDKK